MPEKCADRRRSKKENKNSCKNKVYHILKMNRLKGIRMDTLFSIGEKGTAGKWW